MYIVNGIRKSSLGRLGDGEGLDMLTFAGRVIAIFVLISRSKLVPDFTITLHFFHLIATSFYSQSIPRNWLWWGLQVASSALMASLGIWSCQYRELRPINFGGSSMTQAATTENAVSGGDAAGDEEQGFSRGRGRGRGRDGGGEYEMVGIKSEEQVK